MQGKVHAAGFCVQVSRIHTLEAVEPRRESADLRLFAHKKAHKQIATLKREVFYDVVRDFKECVDSLV